MRVPAFIHSELLPQSVRGTVFDGLFHVTDWLPTLVFGAVGLEKAPSDVFDGHDQWGALISGTESHRKDILLNIDYVNQSTSSGAAGQLHEVWMGNIQVRGRRTAWVPVLARSPSRSLVANILRLVLLIPRS